MKEGHITGSICPKDDGVGRWEEHEFFEAGYLFPVGKRTTRYSVVEEIVDAQAREEVRVHFLDGGFRTTKKGSLAHLQFLPFDDDDWDRMRGRVEGSENWVWSQSGELVIFEPRRRVQNDGGRLSQEEERKSVRSETIFKVQVFEKIVTGQDISDSSRNGI